MNIMQILGCAFVTFALLFMAYAPTGDEFYYELEEKKPQKAN